MIVRADARHIPLPDNSVQCVVTSPPYWGLRQYQGDQDRVWGGDAECAHEWGESVRTPWANDVPGPNGANKNGDHSRYKPKETGPFCQHCGAWRGQFGLEPEIQMYVDHSVEILREIRRVLRPEGVCFYNIGDSYATGAGKVGDCPGGGKQGERWKGYRGSHPCDPKRDPRGGSWEGSIGPMTQPNRMPQEGLKSKDLCLVPFRVALAAQADGWWVRNDIVWSKPDAMPESVRDRCTRSHEFIFVLTKSEKYYWDWKAIAEPCVSGPSDRRKMEESKERFTIHQNDDVLARANSSTNIGRKRAVGGTRLGREGKNSRIHQSRDAYHSDERKDRSEDVGKHNGMLYRNARDVWEFASTSKGNGAHFATFPEELVIRCIAAASRPGDLVLDPFAGSGTVGEVAFNMGRRFLLCDLAYQELQRERVPPMALIESFMVTA